MAFKLYSNVRETTTTTGTGALTLGGAVSGYVAFSARYSDGDTMFVSVRMGANWETFLGTYNSGAGTISRTTMFKSTNADAAVNWGAGTKDIFVTDIGATELDATNKARRFDIDAPTTTRGDLIRRGASANERVAVGTAKQILQSDGTDPVWATVITDWVAYTPTFTGFGTVSGVSIWSRRVGDTLHIRGKFTSGTSTATEARMTLGYNGTNSNVTSDATKVPSIQMAGAMAQAAAGANTTFVLIESNVGYITFSIQNASRAGLTKVNGDALVASGNALSFTAEIPISGW